MLEFLKVLFDWSKIVATGPDAVVYFFMATVGTLLFVIRLAFAMFAGGDTDFDSALEGGDADASFTFFSRLSIMGFFMGTGWMGLACRFDFEMSGPLSAICAAGFGSLMMTFASGLTYATRRLNLHIETVWDAGQKNGAPGSTAGFLRGMIGALPPMHELAKQAGIDLPEFLGGTLKDGDGSSSASRTKTVSSAGTDGETG